MLEGQPQDMAEAARRVREAMTSVHDGITHVAAECGWLMAMADNADRVETLSSVRADMTFQLVEQLYLAYDNLAAHLQDAFA